MLCPTPDAVALTDAMQSPACSICAATPDECFETTQAMWTNHCLMGGDSNFPPGLIIDTGDIIVKKGGNKYVDSYSAFMDNTKKLKTPLDSILKENDVQTIFVVGIATDYCVYYSAIDALSLGYDVFVVLDATRGIAPDTVDAAITDMRTNGAVMLNTSDVLSMICPGGDTSTGSSLTNGMMATTMTVLMGVVVSFAIM
jgi:nicotinamidase-related amidase